jgi:MOSC domain-containing protein YiiM
MNSRVIALLAGDKARWALAGDQLFVDLDLSAENLPPGSRFSLGTGVIEVTSQPHTGCKKFLARYGEDALKFVNSPVGKELHLRGICAKVVQPGTIRTGDAAKKI